MKKFQDFLFKNTSTKQTVAKNTVWLFSGDVFGRLLRMGLIVYAARTLGVAGWGIFSYATSIGIILMTFSDIGISGIITREAAKRGEGYRTLISTALAIKGVLTIVSILFVLIIGPLVSHVPGTHGIFPIIAAISLFDTLRELCFSINNSFEKMEREMFVKTLMNSVILCMGIVLLKLRLDPQSMALAYAIGSAVGFVTIAIMIRKDFKGLLGTIDKRMVQPILSMAWPFAIITLIVIFLANIDTYMLGLWKDATEIGLYASVQRIYAFTAIIPSTISVATFPLMSRLAHTDHHKFRLTLEKALSVLIVLGAPIALGGALLSKELVTLVFGTTFALAAPVMVVMMLMIVIGFPLTLLANAVFAHNKQRSLSGVYVTGILINIALNALFIPKFGALGAASATFVSTLMMTMMVAKKLKKINFFEIVPIVKNIIVPLVILGSAIIGLKHTNIHVIPTIIIGAAAYIGSLFLFKAPLIRDAREIINRQ